MKRPDNRTAELVRATGAVFTRQSQTNAWMRLFTKVNTILAGAKVPTVAEDTHLPHPACTDGTTVKFSNAWVEREVVGRLQGGSMSMARRAMAMLKGINYHELAHVLFSPDRATSPYAAALDAEAVRRGMHAYNVMMPANLLEDQRIESLFAAMYGGSRSYFRASTLLGILTDKNGDTKPESESFLFTWGRRYLPRSLRMAHRAAAEAQWGKTFVAMWTETVDEYCGLNLIDDVDRAAVLTCTATELLASIGVAPPDHGHGRSTPGVDNRPAGLSNDKRARKAAEASRKEIAEDNEKPEEATSGSSGADKDADEDGDEDGAGGGDGAGEDGEDADSDPAGGSGEGDGGEDGDAEGDGASDSEGTGDDGDGSDSDSCSSATSDSSTESGSGAGYVDNDADTDHTVDKPQPTTVAEALEDLMSDDQFAGELSDLLSEFLAESERGDVERPRKNKTGTPVPTLPAHVGTVNRMVKVLNQMRADAGAQAERFMPEGKVHVMDFVARKPWDLDVFRSYEEGHEDEFDMEVVVLLDLSPSMQSLADRASMALWQIKAAMQRFDVPVTAYGYNDGKAKCLYAPLDPVAATSYEHFHPSGGGTDPQDALTRAYNIFTRSAAKRRVLFTITDGEWNTNNRWECDGIVSKINGLKNTTTIIVGLTHVPGSLLSDKVPATYHQHQMGREVMNPEQILDVFKDYVYSIGRKAVLH